MLIGSKWPSRSLDLGHCWAGIIGPRRLRPSLREWVSRRPQARRTPDIRSIHRTDLIEVPRVVHAFTQSHRVQPPGRPEPYRPPRPTGFGAGHEPPGDHRSRGAVRRHRLLPGSQGERHRADHRLRDVRRSWEPARPEPQRQEALPHDRAGKEPGRLRQPGQARDGVPPRGVLLSPEGGQGAAGQAQRGPGHPVRLPGRRGAEPHRPGTHGRRGVDDRVVPGAVSRLLPGADGARRRR